MPCVLRLRARPGGLSLAGAAGTGPRRRAVGGLAGAALVDRALTPKLSPLSSVSAAAGGIGSVAIFQYEICPFCCKVKAMAPQSADWG